MGKKNVVPFSRDRRSPPKWGMGLPPHKKPHRQLHLGKWLVLLFVILVAFAPIIDAVKGFLTPSDGCKVWQITDGDTVKVSCGPQIPDRARIIGYDTPELFSPGCFSEAVMAVRATFYLRWKLWTARHVSVYVRGKDRYSRALIRLEFDHINISETMINAGLAVPYTGGRRINWCQKLRSRGNT